jgi:hypothetical protein
MENTNSTKNVNQYFYISENRVAFKVTLEKSILSPTIPQVQNKISQKSNIRMFNIN